MANEAEKLMNGTTPDGKKIYWLPAKPWIMGDPELASRVQTELFARGFEDGGFMVTPTGPWVPAEESNQLAVFAATNKVTRHVIEWKNAPDVLFDAKYGDADGPSSPPKGEESKESETQGPTGPASPEGPVLSLWSKEELAPLVAAFGIGWRGMSKAERSLKAKRQLRDRFGRFAFMGGHMRWKGSDGVARPGKFLGVTEAGDVLVADEAKRRIRRVSPDDVEVIDARATLADPSEKDVFDFDGDGVINAKEAQARLKALTGQEYGYDKRAARGSPSSADEVRKRVDEVIARMPPPEEAGRMTWEELDERLAAYLNRLEGVEAARRDMLAAQKANDREAFLEAVKRANPRADLTMSDEAIAQEVEDVVKRATRDYLQTKSLKSSQRPGAPGPLDVIGDRLGRQGRLYLGLLLEAGRVVTEEMENRIAEGMPEVDPEELAALEQKAMSFGRAAGQARDAYSRALQAHKASPAGATAAEVDEAGEKYLRLNNAYKRIQGRLRYMQDPDNYDENSPEYRQAQRDYALEILNEVRPMGGTQKYNVTSAQGLTLEEVERIMQEAGDLFPTDWHDARRDHMGPRGTSVTTGGRGGHSDQAGRITISKARGDALKVKEDNGWSNAAAHELAHGMQAALPQIRTAEQLFSLLRSPGGMEQLMKIYADLQEMGYADRWADPYIGKVYGRSLNGRGKETLTTGIQALFFGDRFFSRSEAMGGFDYQFRAFILGLLVTLR